MKRNLALSILFVPLAAAAGTQTVPAAPANPPAKQIASAQQSPSPQTATPEKAASPKPAQPANSGNDLSTVLVKMNQSAAGFKSAQGDFEYVTYQKLVDDKFTQNGHIYFRRTDKGVDAAFDIEGAAPKQVVYKNGKLQIYEKKINQVTERIVDKNKSDVEAFLSLGFGASGKDLLRDYDVQMDGWETIGGVKTAKLDLTPKSEKLRRTYSKIVLWIDPEKDVLEQQQFFEPSGDYRLAHYTNMKLNGNISNDKFNLKTSGKVTTVRAQ
jgi:outer membrane lipoprotein-sorting protein